LIEGSDVGFTATALPGTGVTASAGRVASVEEKLLLQATSERATSTNNRIVHENRQKSIFLNSYYNYESNQTLDYVGNT